MASALLVLGLSLASVAQPCLSDWSYRVPIDITNAGTALTDYQVLLTFNSSTLVAQGKAKVDAGDIRVLDAIGNPLNFWIEEETFNTTNTHMWVKVPSLPTGASTLYLFYGNSSAASTASGDDTFPVFDDFSGGFNPTKWETCGTVPAYNLGSVRFDSGSGKSVLHSKTEVSGQVVAQMGVKSADNGLGFIGLQSAANQGYGLVYDEDGAGASFMRLGLLSGGNCTAIGTESANISYQANSISGSWEFSWSQTGLQQFTWPGSASGNITRANANYPFINLSKVTLGNIADVTNNTGTLEVAWVFARQWAAIAPSISFGAETTLLTSIEADNGGPYCAGETVQLTASTVSGGTYFWTGPNSFSSTAQNPTISNASAAYSGTYTLTVSASASGCAAIVTTTDVTVFPQTVAGTVSGAAQVCEGSNSGSVMLSGQTGNVVRWESSTTGGAPWSTINETTTNLAYTNLNVTTYYRAVVKSGVCNEQYSNSVKIQVDPQTVAGRVSGSAEVCSGTNSGLLTLTEYTGSVLNWQASADGGATYQDLSTGSGAQFTYSNLSQTTLFRAVVQSGTCALAYSEPATVLVNPLPVPVFTATTECQGNATQFTNSSTVSSGSITSYNWDFGDGTGSTVRNPRHTFTEAGTYTVTLEVTTAKGCQERFTENVTVNYVPTANFTAQDVCLNSPVNFINQSTLPVGTIQSYQWQFGDGQTSTEANPSYTYSAAATYSVTLTVTSIDGCTNSVSKSVTVNPRANLNFSYNNACLGQPTRFQNNSNIKTGSITYLWNFDDGTTSTQTNPQHTFTEAGTYFVTLQSTSDQGCTDEVTEEVVVYAQPEAAFSVENVCLDTEAQFVNNSSVSDNGQLRYSWKFGDGTASSQANPTHRYARPGTYTVDLTVETADGGCISTTQEAVEIYPMPVANFDFNSVCFGNAIQFTNTSTIPSGTLFYTWNFGDGNSSNSKEPSYTYTQAGTYTVTLTVNSEFRCENIISRQVTVNPLPQPAFTAANVCDGDPAGTQFQNTSTIAEGLIVSYLWNFGEGNATSVAENPSHTYLNPGTYTVSLQATSNKGCVETYTNTITVSPRPVPDFTVAGVCLGQASTFVNQSDANGGGNLTYAWYANGQRISTSTSPTYTFGEAGLHEVRLIAYAAGGCSDEVTYTAEVYARPEVTLTSDTLISRGYEVPLLAQGGVSYSWLPNDGTLNNINVPNPTARPFETTTYTVTVTNARGCTSTKEVTIYVEDDFKVSASNVLTPDGNGKNDTWVIENIDAYGEANVTVYDRWGNLIYEATNYQNDWGGTRNNDILPDGTYYYTIRFNSSDEVYRGALTIIRNK
jgi:gliding motility-associated-like protein